MATVKIDTLRFANKLKEVGFSASQAETFAQLQFDAFYDSEKITATKNDLVLLEQRLTIKLGGMMVVMIGVLSTVLKLLH